MSKTEPTRFAGHSVLELFGDLTDEAGPRVARALMFTPAPQAERPSPRKKAGIIAMIVAGLVLLMFFAGMLMAFATVIAVWAAGVALVVMIVRGIKRLFTRPIRAGRAPSGGRGASHP